MPPRVLIAGPPRVVGECLHGQEVGPPVGEGVEVTAPATQGARGQDPGGTRARGSRRPGG